MTNTKKQLKITKLFRKGATTRVPEDCDDIQEEIQQLEQKLKEKQDELFQIQRSHYKCKASPPKKKTEAFIRPQKIILSNSVESLKRGLELMSMLTGVEVQSYVADDHCCIVYHMQTNTQHQVKHGLRIDMKTVSGDNVVSKSSLPLGFNMKAVMEGYQNVMMPECLGAIRKALVAYYDRLEQFDKLKKLLKIEAQLFKVLDGSHIEISFYAQSENEEEDERVHVTLILDYRVYDIRPKMYSFKQSDLPEGVSEILTQQCAIFKKKPLHKAFKEAFVNGVGAYKLIQQVGVRAEQRPRPQKRSRPNKNYHNDDTFLPEDCSDQGEDDEAVDD
ncbi:uncharacterized protein [Epargyreus clarus]|uniref:uncharacterized protein n=1 Tax=Epargyreus clarus TaxID=520877 RepID=UPI003C30C6C3